MPISVVMLVVMPVMSIRMVIRDVARIVDLVSVTRILAVIRPVMVKAESKSYMALPEKSADGVSAKAA
jgi:hypothetical protein